MHTVCGHALRCFALEQVRHLLNVIAVPGNDQVDVLGKNGTRPDREATLVAARGKACSDG